jgi:hypothetical protein
MDVGWMLDGWNGMGECWIGLENGGEVGGRVMCVEQGVMMMGMGGVNNRAYCMQYHVTERFIALSRRRRHRLSLSCFFVFQNLSPFALCNQNVAPILLCSCC